MWDEWTPENNVYEPDCLVFTACSRRQFEKEMHVMNEGEKEEVLSISTHIEKNKAAAKRKYRLLREQGMHPLLMLTEDEVENTNN